MTAVMATPNFLIWRSSGVSSALTLSSIWLMRPSSVALPVPTTTPVARPETTSVPENAMFARSPTVALADTGSVDLSAGTDSPVSAASSVRRFFTSVRRRSAGTLSPDSSSTMSPGTSPSAGIRRAAPRSGLRGQHVADRGQGLLRPALLNEPEQRVDEDHAQDDGRVEPQVRHEFDEAGGEQNIDQDVVELQQETQERPPPGRFRQPVGTVFRQALGDFSGVEACLGISVQPPHHVV